MRWVGLWAPVVFCMALLFVASSQTVPAGIFPGARITHGGSQRGLGTFPTQEEAARAFDAAVRTHGGPNPAVNFPVPDSGEANGK